jgi:hypothetical protein
MRANLLILTISLLLLGLPLLFKVTGGVKVTEGAKGGRKKKSKKSNKKKKKKKKKRKARSCPPIMCTPPPSFAMRQYLKMPSSVRGSINTIVPNIIQTWVRGIFA